jgi:hypothetical protein
MFYPLLRFLVIVIVIYIILKTVKIARILLTVVLAIVYIPINTLNTAVQKWYFQMKHKDEVIYYAFTPIYWLLVAITFIVSVPYEFVIAMDLH